MKHWTTFLAGFLVVATLGLAVPGAAYADSKPAQRMDDATSVLNQFVNIPESSIPPSLLNQAYGIAVIPSVLKIGFIGAFRRGHGVLSVRTADGHWSDPTFITLTGGSIGFQAGASSTDIILVFKTRRSVQKIANGQFTLGADAAVAAGPVGRSTGAATNGRLDAAIYSYSRSRGIFAGVALDGARIGIDNEANWRYYNKIGISAQTILSRSDQSDLPKSGQQFVYTLNQYMPPSNDQFHYPANTGNAGAGNQLGSQSGAGQSSNQSGSELYGRTYSNNNTHSNIQVQQRAGEGQTSDYSGSYGNGSGSGSGAAAGAGGQSSGQ